MAVKGSLLLLVRRGSEVEFVEEKVSPARERNGDEKECRHKERIHYKEAREKTLKKQGSGYACEMQKKNTKSGRRFLGLALQTIKNTPRNFTREKEKAAAKMEVDSAEPRRSASVSIASGYFIEPKSPQLTTRTARPQGGEAKHQRRNVSSARALPKIVLSQETRSPVAEHDFGKRENARNLSDAAWLQVGRPRSRARSVSPPGPEAGRLPSRLTPMARTCTPRSATSEDELDVTRKRLSGRDDARRKTERRRNDNFNVSVSLSALPLTQRENVSDSEAENPWVRLDHVQSHSDSYLAQASPVLQRVGSWTEERENKPRARSIEVFLPSVETMPS